MTSRQHSPSIAMCTVKAEIRTSEHLHDHRGFLIENGSKMKEFKKFLRNALIHHRTSSLAWKFFRLSINVAVCLLYLARTVLDVDPASGGCCERVGEYSWCCPDYTQSNNSRYFMLVFVRRPDVLWILQVFFAIVSLLNLLVNSCLSYKRPLKSFARINPLIEIATGLPLVLSIVFSPLRNIYFSEFLHCFVARSILREILNEIHQGKLTYRYIVTKKAATISATVFCLVISGTCGLQHLERIGRGLSLFDAFWFVIVTFSTVGYGDIVPQSWIGKTWVIFMIITTLVIIPRELEEFALAIISYRSEAEASYSKHVNNNHIVVCLGTIKANLFFDFAEEFYMHPPAEEIQVVLLSPNDLDPAVRLRLQSPRWWSRITYLKGSALNDDDLRRARVDCAVGCFILSDRTSNPDEADKQVILRTWAIKDFAPNVPLFVQIIKPENKFHVSFAESVVCDEEVKNAVLASNCVCPGVSTLVTLLLHTFDEQPCNDANLSVADAYLRSASNEIYCVMLGKSCIFSQYQGTSFNYAASEVFVRLGVTLFAVRPAERQCILLNPGHEHILSPGDECFYISTTSKGNLSSIVTGAVTCPSNTKRLLLQQQPEENQLLFASPSSVRTMSLKEPSMCLQVMARTHSQESETDSIFSGLHSDTHMRSMDSSDDSLNDLGTFIPEYREGFPPVTPYIGFTPLKCHLLDYPSEFCCLELNARCEHRQGLSYKDMLVRVQGALIVSSQLAGAGLYNFILPLRADYRPKCTLRPIIFLFKERPPNIFLESIAVFPMVFFMVGSLSSLDDVLEAGILHADTLVITGSRSSCNLLTDEYMDDANAIVESQTIYRLFPRIKLMVELTHTSNMRFMKFDAEQIHRPSSTSTCTSSSSRRAINDLSYLSVDTFASGNVFSTSMLDTLLCQAFFRDYLIKLVSLLLGCDQNPGSGYLTSITITTDMLWLRTYGRLFQRLGTTSYDIPIGLYRYVKSSCGKVTPIHGTRKYTEKQGIKELLRERLNVLGIDGEANFNRKHGRGFVVINPPTEYPVLKDDIIYVIRVSPQRSCSST